MRASLRKQFRPRLKMEQFAVHCCSSPNFQACQIDLLQFFFLFFFGKNKGSLVLNNNSCLFFWPSESQRPKCKWKMSSLFSCPCACLRLSPLSKVFSRWNFAFWNICLIFPRKKKMTFYAYFGEETICMSCKTFFSGKITKNITSVLGFSCLYKKKKKKKKKKTR